MCAYREPIKETDFFRSAVQSAIYVIMKHKICQNAIGPVEGFFMHLAKLYGGASAYFHIVDEQHLDHPINQKCCSIFEKYKGERIVGEWMLGDHKAFYGNPVTEALLILGDLLVNPQRREDYTGAPKVVQDFTELMEFSVAYMNEMHPIIYEYIEELQKYAKQFESADRALYQSLMGRSKKQSSGCLVTVLTFLSVVSFVVFALISLLL